MKLLPKCSYTLRYKIKKAEKIITHNDTKQPQATNTPMGKGLTSNAPRGGRLGPPTPRPTTLGPRLSLKCNTPIRYARKLDQNNKPWHANS